MITKRIVILVLLVLVVFPVSTAQATWAKYLRWMEVRQFNEERLEGKELLYTTILYNGDVVDWIIAESYPQSLVPQPDAPAPTSYPFGVIQHRSLLHTTYRPPGTVPFIRATFDNYVNGSSGFGSLKEFLDNIPHALGGNEGSQRLYTSIKQDINQGNRLNKPGPINRGIHVRVNAIWLWADLPVGREFSIFQTNIVDRGTWPAPDPEDRDNEWLGVIVGRMPSLDDAWPRINYEFMTDSSEQDDLGDWLGGFASHIKGYVPVVGTVWPPGVALDPYIFSSWNGPQAEIDIQIQWFGPGSCYLAGCDAAWWVAINDSWVGYFPIGTSPDESCQDKETCPISFDLLHQYAEGVSLYAEVYDGTDGSQPGESWTNADMGRGTFPPNVAPNGSYLESAYVQNPRAFTYDGSVWDWEKMPIDWFVQASKLGSGDPECYRGELVEDDPRGEGVAVWFYYGGAGGDLTECEPYKDVQP